MLPDILRHDLRYTLRGLRAHPAFAATVALTMALGMGANATIFGIVDRLLFRGPPGIDKPESVVVIETRSAGSQYTNTTFSYAEYTDYRGRPGGFSAVAAVSGGASFPLGRGRDATRVSGSLTTASLFTALGVKPVLGRFFTADDDNERNPRAVAVISYGFWQQRFGGGRGAVGKSLELGDQRFVIVGVAPKGFSGVNFTNVDVWLPIAAASGLRFDSSPTWTTNRGNTWLTILARLEPNVSPALAAEQATAVHRAALRMRIDAKPSLAKYIKPDSESVELASLVPGKAQGGATGGVASQDVKVSRLLAIVSFIVLVIACANVANLLLVRGFNRRREIAVRLALGVGRSRLVGQLLVEGLVLAALGGAGGLLIARWTSQAVRTLLLGQDAWTADAIDGRLLAFTAAMTISTGLLTSVIPALSASRTDLATALKAGAREGGGHRSPTRAALLVIQAALALVLLAGAGLFVRSMRNVNALPLGVDLNHVLVADIAHKAAGLTNAETHRLFNQFQAEVKRVPGVTASAVSIGLPFALNWGADLKVPGRTVATQQQSAQYVVTPEYFTTLGIPILQGRAFDATDRAGTALVAIISAKAASVYFPHENPVGQCVKVGGDTVPCTTIVGVAANTVKQGLDDVVPQVYRPLDQIPESFTDNTVSFFGYELVARTSGDAGRYAESVRRVIQGASASVPYANVRPMRDLFGRRTRTWALGAKVFSAFGALALALAAVGLYSVLAFSLAQRSREFGVRIALGARSENLIYLGVRKGLVPAAAGVAVGLLITLAAGRFVDSLLYHVSPKDPAILAGVCGILFAAALVASLIPAVRLTRVDPMAVLRTE